MTASEYIKFLKAIYNCDQPFELYISNRKTKKTLGTYFINKRKINLYSYLIKHTHSDMREVAIHEYAHHIHYTELKVPNVYERPHGPNFWRIYSALMAKAIIKGIHRDEYIEKIIKK